MEISGERPAAPRYVLVASPHSSNWDTAVMLLFAAHFGIRLRWIGKRESFRWPLGPVLRRLGGIPIDRGGGQGVVAATAAVFRGRAELALAIAPDGTRRARDYWRSGFYHIARAAEVPLVLSFLDWGARRAGIGPTPGPQRGRRRRHGPHPRVLRGHGRPLSRADVAGPPARGGRAGGEIDDSESYAGGAPRGG